MGNKELENRFAGKDNHGKPKMDFINKLLSMTNEDLQKECGQYIWLSAYAANNPRSDFHWMCDACYAVCSIKDKINLYENAYNEIARDYK